MNILILVILGVLTFITGCTMPTAPVELTIAGTAVFHTAQSIPDPYPAAGTQHELKAGQNIALEITLTGVGSFTGTPTGLLATCPVSAQPSTFTVIVTDTLVVNDHGTYSSVLNFAPQEADFGNGCKTTLFTARSLTTATVKATITFNNDTCMNYSVNKILFDCETECTGNTVCLSQCPISRVPGAVHGCSPVALANPLSPKNIIARPVISPADLGLLDSALLSGTLSGNITGYVLEFSELE